MKFVDNVDKAGRMWSVQSMIATLVLIIAEILPLWESLIPDNIFLVLSAITASASMALRLIKQRNLENE